jgi:hypothetical protein
MLFLLPLEGFPILLAASGIVRLVRGVRDEQPRAGPAPER